MAHPSRLWRGFGGCRSKSPGATACLVEEAAVPTASAEQCQARVSCGDKVLYGFQPSSVTCAGTDTATDPTTSDQDGDPALSLRKTELTLSDDASGRLGAFSLRAHLK